MAKCDKCRKKVNIDPYSKYVYVTITDHKSSPPERRHYYHVGCFLGIIRKSKFYNEIVALAI